jgi:Uma2 family endonuclease
MATQLARKRFTVDEYYRMAEVGLLTEDDRVELIQGEIFQMAPIGSRHAACVKRLTELFVEQAKRRATVGVQDAVRLGQHTELQPDLTVSRRKANFYEDAHPTPEDVLLVVEVADTTVEHDRSVKLPLYATTGVPEAWLVDLNSRRVEVYRTPTPEGYSEIRILWSGDLLAPQAFPDIQISVDEVLGAPA